MLKKIRGQLYLLRKAFLSGFFQLHYSQFGEDIILKELLKKKCKTTLKGFYVDVGCYHPRKFSNTYMLYKWGWNGINIDLEEDKVKLFNLLRPRDINVLAPVSDKEEIVKVHRYGKFGVGSTIDADYAAKTEDKLYDVIELTSKTLDQVINESPYKGRQIDVLSIDVEGMDYRVLSSLSIDIYKPKIIIIEEHCKTIDEILNTKTYSLLRQCGYILRSWTFYSLIFIYPGSDIIKEREAS
jgi:FkbM family methyltransferase